MKRFTTSRISNKQANSPHQCQRRHSRNHSNKSSHMFNNKVRSNTHLYDKMLTQTTASKNKASQQLSPKRSRSNSKKSKVENSKATADGKQHQRTRKGRSQQQQLQMARSLNIPHLEPYLNESFLPNSSQQLTTHHLQQSLWIPPSFSDLLTRTQKVCEHYQKTCKSMEKQQREVERELLLAKAQIMQLKSRLGKRKSRQQ